MEQSILCLPPPANSITFPKQIKVLLPVSDDGPSEQDPLKLTILKCTKWRSEHNKDVRGRGRVQINLDFKLKVSGSGRLFGLQISSQLSTSEDIKVD